MSRVLEEFPSIALRDFYLSPEFKQVHAVYGTSEIQDLVDRIGESAAVAILEGTGTYSYFWTEQLQKKGIFVLVAVSMDGEIDSPEFGRY
jgi:transposase